jgi:hypothetical protein
MSDSSPLIIGFGRFDTSDSTNKRLIAGLANGSIFDVPNIPGIGGSADSMENQIEQARISSGRTNLFSSMYTSLIPVGGINMLNDADLAEMAARGANVLSDLDLYRRQQR